MVAHVALPLLTRERNKKYLLFLFDVVHLVKGIILPGGAGENLVTIEGYCNYERDKQRAKDWASKRDKVQNESNPRQVFVYVAWE